MKIGSREVGPGAPVFVVAECGSNHGGSLDRALALIDAAADAGADAAKFQAFSVDRFIVPRENPEALRKYELPWVWLPMLADQCDKRGIEFLCTAFDIDSLNAVDPWVRAHKVGSYEAANAVFGAAVAAKGKPRLISHGRLEGQLLYPNSVALRCVSEYPAPLDGYLRGNFGYAGRWGVSDHTLHPTIVPAAAVALGACVVEKHFRGPFVDSTTLDSPDAPVSINDIEFGELVEAVRLTEKAVRG